MIRVGIVGSNFGRTVLLPAFRADRRCEVVALAGRDAQKAADHAREAGIARAFKSWAELVEDDAIDAVAIATPPALQPDIAIQALAARQGRLSGKADGRHHRAGRRAARAGAD